MDTLLEFSLLNLSTWAKSYKNFATKLLAVSLGLLSPRSVTTGFSCGVGWLDFFGVGGRTVLAHVFNAYPGPGAFTFGVFAYRVSSDRSSLLGSTRTSSTWMGVPYVVLDLMARQKNVL